MIPHLLLAMVLLGGTPGVEAPTPGATPESGAAERFGTLFGTVRASGTDQVIDGATVTVADPLIQFRVGSDGRFLLNGIPLGARTLFVAADGFELKTLEIEVTVGTNTIDVELVKVSGSATAADPAAPEANYEDEITVVAERESIAPARRKLEREEVRLVPGSWGDPFRAAQTLPGVARSFLGFFGELAVRGSAPEDTRLYVDGHEVPLLYHFGGLKSLINPQSIDDIDFIPGGFGAYYGRATGGVLDAKTRSDIPDKPKYHLQTDLLDTGVFAQFPVGTGAISIAGRRSYIDAFIRGAGSLLGEEVIAPRYYDYQLKGDYVLSNGDQIGGVFFGTDDAFVGDFGTENSEEQEFLRTIYNQLQGRWRRDFGGRTLKVSGAFGLEKGLLAGGISLKPTYHSGLRLDHRMELPYDLTWNAGIDAKTKYQDPNFSLEQPGNVEQGPPDTGGPVAGVAQSQEEPDILEIGEPRKFLTEAAVYSELEWKPDRQWSLVPGIRFEYYDSIRRGVVDPRFAVRYALSPETTLMAASGLYSQPPRIGLLGLFVFDLGQLGVEIEPERAVHAVIGVEQSIGDLMSFDAYTYYKQMDHLVEITALDFTGVLTGEDALLTLDGTGRAYGLELMLRLYPTERLFAWVAYSLSRAERFNENTKQWFPFGYNQTHNLSIVASYQVTRTVRVGGRVRYVSGNPYTPITGSIFNSDTGEYQPIFGDLLSATMPPYFQADLRVDKRWEGKVWNFVLFADIMNVTNRRNPEFVTAESYNYDYSRVDYFKGLPILPMIGLEAYR